MDDLDLAEALELKWAEFPKGEVWQETKKGHTWLCLAVEFDEIRLHLAAFIGPRGGIIERICIFDSSRPTLAARIILFRSNRAPDGMLLPLEEMTKGHRPVSVDALQACRVEMGRLLEKFRGPKPGLVWKDELRSMGRTTVG